MKVMSVLLTGGEPMAHPDLFTIIEAIVRNRMRFQMNSNGTLFDREKAAAIAATSRCNTVQISVDGSCPEIHDAIRGKGSFARMVRGIEALKNAGVPVSVRVTINRINFRDLPNIFRFLINDFEIRGVSTNEAFPRGAAQCNISHLDMTPKERRESEKISLELAQTYPTIGAMAGPLVIGRKLKEIDEDLKKPPELRKKGKGYLSACGIASNGLAIMHDGKVVPCHQLPHMVLGQVGVDPIKRIWHESVGLHYLRTRHRIPLDALEECRGCKYQPYCTGGCPATAYAATGKTTSRDPRSCYRALKGEDPEFEY
jgi:SynChlorMet cassette radical SAM/SPASM protein ScmE